ncbi:MAG: tellurite resistance TerB family protein [Alphaproteobacteria bacterium]
MIDHHEALIYTMVLISAADQNMTDTELQTIGDLVNHLPVFGDFDRGRLVGVAENCATVLGDEDGLNKAIELIKSNLPAKLRETAYALACEVAAAGGQVSQEELRLLEMFRHSLEVDRLTAAAIERGVRARYMVL